MSWMLITCPRCLSPNDGDGEFDCDICWGGYGQIIRSREDEQHLRELVGEHAWRRFMIQEVHQAIETVKTRGFNI